MSLEKKPEILAPAGTLEAVQQVIDAGADAVYVGGKGLNMRQHRTSYNLTEPQIAEAIDLVHGQGKKALLHAQQPGFDSQIPQLRETLWPCSAGSAPTRSSSRTWPWPVWPARSACTSRCTPAR